MFLRDLRSKSIIDTRQFKNPDVLSKVLDLAEKMEEYCRLGDEYKAFMITGKFGNEDDIEYKESLKYEYEKDFKNNYTFDSYLELKRGATLGKLKIKYKKLKKELTFDNFLEKPIMVSFFAQPSTRTRFSFESAITRLGGNLFGSENAAEFSSFAKGESIEDAAQIMSGYGDVIVMRHKGDEKHPGNKVAVDFAYNSRVPVINAGAGTDQHPTQSLLDVYTIRKELGKLEGLNVAFIGDLKNGRTVRSLTYLLAQQNGNKLFFVSTSNYQLELDIKGWLREKMDKTGVRFNEIDVNDEKEVMKVLSDSDVIYMTRLQKEYEKDRPGSADRSAFVLKPESMKYIK